MKPTERFGDRADDYVKYRPSYPHSVLEFFRSELSLSADHVVADVGSGTGISAELFLRNGNPVYGVEPNASMRAAAERVLAKFPRFQSIEGTAEATTLADHSVDLVVAAQAFHWFDPVSTKREFQRILKPDGSIALIWNDRRTTGSAFAGAYEDLIHRYAIDYARVNHKNVDAARLKEFLGTYCERTFYNAQVLDFEGLLGRLTSSSYMPNTDHPRFPAMREDLLSLFAKFSSDQCVALEYDTRVFYTQFSAHHPQK